MQEQSIQGLIFLFAEQLNEGQPSKQKVVNIIKAIYMIQLIFVFLVVSDPQNAKLASFVQSNFLIITLGSYLILLLLQIFIAVFNHVQFQLMYQILIFRYLMFPIFLLALAAQIRTPDLLPFQTSILAYVLLIIICTFITVIAFNQYDEQKLQVNSCKMSILLVLSDSIMTIILPLRTQSQYVSLLVIWFFLQSIVAYNLKKPLMYKISKLLNFMVYQKHFFLYLCLLTQIIYPKIVDETLMIAIFVVSLPIILILLLETICYKQSTKIDENIFIIQAPLSCFSQIVYQLSEQLVLYKSNLNKKFEQSFMITFIAAHMDKCDVSNCGLSHQSTIQELKSCNQVAHRKTIFYKVIKKLEFLFELYEQRYPNDLELKIMLLQFYSSHLPNKLKLRQSIEKVKKHKLGFQQQLLLHRLQKKMKKIQTAELIDTKSQDQYHNVQKIILQNLTYLKEFWNVLLQEKVDLNKLILISGKLFHLKSQLQNTWKKHLSQIRFVSWKIIKVYAIYRRLILHDSTKACILEDYCKIIQERIKNKYQLAYISVETQKGLVAISLSESSLGNIVSVNNQTVKLFNYISKSQMISLRVNDIMPIVYSIVHDDILGSFLKNRYKKINQDQRLLFAKNKNGFIFPFLLQLNKMSWNTNDELIFISNVQLRKCKKAPIYCMTDLEGNIQDKTSTYYWLFNSGKKNEKGKIQNIQQLIPNFFQIVQKEIIGQHNTKFQFEERLLVKKTSGQFQIAFSAVSLYIKNQKVGYLVQGTTIAPSFTLSQKLSLKQVLRQNDYFFRKNYYNPQKYCYEIGNINEKQSNFSSKIGQLQIPYMKSVDFKNLFNKQIFETNDEIEKDYARNIKTLRLKNNKLQLAYEEQAFQSFEIQSQMKEKSVLKRIQQMKEQLNVQQSKDLSFYYRIITTLICVLTILLSILLIVNTNDFELQEHQEHQTILEKAAIKKLLPQFLVYTYFPSSIANYQPVKSTIKTQLIKSVISSSIDDDKKEKILKSIYYAQINQTLYLQNDTFDFTSSEQLINSKIFTFLYSVLACSALYVLVLLLMFIFFKYTINNLYSIFLSISDRKLQLILLESTKLHQFLSAKSLEQDVFQVFQQQVTENQDEQFQRAKKTKTQFSSQDWKMLCQLVLPMLIVLSFSIFSSIYMTLELNNHSTEFQIWKNTQQIFPQTSVIMLQSLMNQRKGMKLNLTNNFSFLMQKFQQEIFVNNLDFNQQQIAIKGDPCKAGQFKFSQNVDFSSFCSKQTYAFDNSLSNQLNLIYLYLISNSTKTQEQWTKLINLQYNLVGPLVENAANMVENRIYGQISSISKTLIIIMTMQVLLVIIATLYITCYPIRTIQQKLLFTKDLISIIPAQREVMPIEVFANLATQAIQFKEQQ